MRAVSLEMTLLYLSPCDTVTIYTTIDHELLKVKIRHYSSGQFGDNSTDGVLSNLVRLDYDVCSTMNNVCAITGRVVAIYD